jgi:hypothetical protein
MSEGFFDRWSRRKQQVREGEVPPPEPVAAVPVEPAALVETPGPRPDLPPEGEGEMPPPLTLADAKALTIDSDFKPFVAKNVAPEVKNAAFKKLFADPHFNVMDGLDTYIDDYNKPDPLPEGWLRQMVQSQLLGLFADEPKTETQPEPAPAPAAHENTDLQLQPVDDAGRTGPEPGAGEDAASQP